MTTDAVTAELLAMGPFARAEAPFGTIRMEGPDAADYLQRLCSQDIVGLGPDVVAPAAFLDAKGKVIATCHVFRADGALWLEAQRPQLPTLLELLERYHFSEQLSFGEVTDRVCREVVRLATPDDGPGVEVDADGAACTVSIVRRGVSFVRRHAAEPVAGDERELVDDVAECLRMAAGFVRIGVETEPSTLALEADLDDHCSTTKGCYTGQEIVARIHTYGHTNRKLCFLHLDAGERIDAPLALHEPEDDIPVGRVMHAVSVPGHELRCGLGYLPPDFQAPDCQLKLVGGGAVKVVW